MLDPDEFASRKQAFGAAVDVYDRSRPDYSVAAVAWCLAPAGKPPLRVVDVGAGTGKLTGALLALGHEVVAVEPDEMMLARLRDVHGDDAQLTFRTGSAEDLGLSDGTVDAVIAGQAWHWFDEQLAGAEFARVLRPGGIAAAIWNTRNEAVDWVREWSEVVEEGAYPSGRKLIAHQGGPVFGTAFGDREDATFHHEQRLTPADVVALAASRSHTITLSENRRASLLADVDHLVASHPDLVGRDTITLPYLVECHRAQRLAGD